MLTDPTVCPSRETNGGNGAGARCIYPFNQNVPRPVEPDAESTRGVHGPDGQPVVVFFFFCIASLPKRRKWSEICFKCCPHGGFSLTRTTGKPAGRLRSPWRIDLMERFRWLHSSDISNGKRKGRLGLVYELSSTRRTIV
ncbi:hypothetical protein ZHAS_00010909 [Anopheles sinensis]|uniref:Uncharacterized protein n=1 Tax=Anopheles sinensis TaxID=74873 RepID=A0A084VYU4_ANOSI|nr:hypothetical protein ZHAS_00010909 [Anopheles sinensis]